MIDLVLPEEGKASKFELKAVQGRVPGVYHLLAEARSHHRYSCTSQRFHAHILEAWVEDLVPVSVPPEDLQFAALWSINQFRHMLPEKAQAAEDLGGLFSACSECINNGTQQRGGQTHARNKP